MKQNITLALDRQILKAVRTFSAQRGISVSAMLAEELQAKMEYKNQYDRAKHEALALLAQPWSLGGQGTYDRDGLHDRSALR